MRNHSMRYQNNATTNANEIRAKRRDSLFSSEPFGRKILRLGRFALREHADLVLEI